MNESAWPACATCLHDAGRHTPGLSGPAGDRGHCTVLACECSTYRRPPARRGRPEIGPEVRGLRLDPDVLAEVEALADAAAGVRRAEVFRELVDEALAARRQGQELSGNSPVRTTPAGVLLCPRCGAPDTHLDFVHVSARREDGPFSEIEIDATAGTITPTSEPGPAGTAVGSGRRHRIAVRGDCEQCGKGWALVFTQHKGATFVEWAGVAGPNG